MRQYKGCGFRVDILKRSKPIIAKMIIPIIYLRISAYCDDDEQIRDNVSRLDKDLKFFMSHFDTGA